MRTNNIAYNANITMQNVDNRLETIFLAIRSLQGVLFYDVSYYPIWYITEHHPHAILICYFRCFFSPSLHPCDNSHYVLLLIFCRPHILCIFRSFSHPFTPILSSLLFSSPKCVGFIPGHLYIIITHINRVFITTNANGATHIYRIFTLTAHIKQICCRVSVVCEVKLLPSHSGDTNRFTYPIV